MASDERTGAARHRERRAADEQPPRAPSSAIFLPIAAIVGAVLFVGWILALFSLVTQHTVFGWSLPHGMPIWVGILVLALLYFAISAPLKAIRHGGHQAAGIFRDGARCTGSCG